jgi:hypothetical protein
MPRYLSYVTVPKKTIPAITTRDGVQHFNWLPKQWGPPETLQLLKIEVELDHQKQSKRPRTVLDMLITTSTQKAQKDGEGTSEYEESIVAKEGIGTAQSPSSTIPLEHKPAEPSLSVLYTLS